MSRETLRMGPETRRRIDQWYEAAGCRSRNQFVEEAVNFYADHLALGDSGQLLPAAVLSSIDGRLGLFEKRLAALLFKQAVEQDMTAGILADVYRLDEEEMRRRRAESVQNVKRTNGSLTFRQKAAKANEVEAEADEEAEEDDEWLG